MAELLDADRRQDDAAFDAVVIRVDQLHALAGLLSPEEVAEHFADLSTGAQVSIFSLFEDGLSNIRASLGIAASSNDTAEGGAR